MPTLLLPPPSRPTVDQPTLALDLVTLLTYTSARPRIVPVLAADHLPAAGKQVASLARYSILRVWAPWLDTELAISTATRYRRDLEQFARWVQTAYLVANPEEVTAGMVAKWYVALVSEQTHGVITPAALARKTTTLRRALKYAEKLGLVRAGLAAVEMPQVPAPRAQVTIVLDRDWFNDKLN